VSDIDFKAGDHVRYVPYHAHGDLTHPDCEDGVVTSTNDAYVFVRFGTKTQSQACKRDQLVRA
jgi:hypothetical protein